MLSSTLFALAKQSKNLGAYKMARTAYDKLQVCVVCIFNVSLRKKSLCGLYLKIPKEKVYKFVLPNLSLAYG